MHKLAYLVGTTKGEALQQTKPTIFQNNYVKYNINYMGS